MWCLVVQSGLGTHSKQASAVKVRQEAQGSVDKAGRHLLGAHPRWCSRCPCWSARLQTGEAWSRAEGQPLGHLVGGNAQHGSAGGAGTRHAVPTLERHGKVLTWPLTLVAELVDARGRDGGQGRCEVRAVVWAQGHGRHAPHSAAWLMPGRSCAHCDSTWQHGHSPWPAAAGGGKEGGFEVGPSFERLRRGSGTDAAHGTAASDLSCGLTQSSMPLTLSMMGCVAASAARVQGAVCSCAPTMMHAAATAGRPPPAGREVKAARRCLRSAEWA